MLGSVAFAVISMVALVDATCFQPAAEFVYGVPPCQNLTWSKYLVPASNKTCCQVSLTDAPSYTIKNSTFPDATNVVQLWWDFNNANISNAQFVGGPLDGRCEFDIDVCSIGDQWTLWVGYGHWNNLTKRARLDTMIVNTKRGIKALL
jgi:hypothetical protein